MQTECGPYPDDVPLASWQPCHPDFLRRYSSGSLSVPDVTLFSAVLVHVLIYLFRSSLFCERMAEGSAGPYFQTLLFSGKVFEPIFFGLYFLGHI